MFPPPPATILPARSSTECFPYAPHKLPNFSDQQHILPHKCPVKFEVHVDIRMRKTLKVRNEEMEKWEMRKWN